MYTISDTVLRTGCNGFSSLSLFFFSLLSFFLFIEKQKQRAGDRARVIIFGKKMINRDLEIRTASGQRYRTEHLGNANNEYANAQIFFINQWNVGFVPQRRAQLQYACIVLKKNIFLRVEDNMIKNRHFVKPFC